jgi:hypothetical protein
MDGLCMGVVHAPIITLLRIGGRRIHLTS